MAAFLAAGLLAAFLAAGLLAAFFAAVLFLTAGLFFGTGLLVTAFFAAGLFLTAGLFFAALFAVGPVLFLAVGLEALTLS